MGKVSFSLFKVICVKTFPRNGDKSYVRHNLLSSPLRPRAFGSPLHFQVEARTPSFFIFVTRPPPHSQSVAWLLASINQFGGRPIIRFSSPFPSPIHDMTLIPWLIHGLSWLLGHRAIIPHPTSSTLMHHRIGLHGALFSLYCCTIVQQHICKSFSAFDGRTFTRRDRQVYAAAVNNGGMIADIDIDGSGGSEEHSPIGAAGKCQI